MDDPSTLPPSVADARDAVIAAAKAWTFARPSGDRSNPTDVFKIAADLSRATRALADAEEAWGPASDIVRAAEEKAAAEVKSAAKAWAIVRRLKADMCIEDARGARLTVDRTDIGYRLILPNVWRYGVQISADEARDLTDALVAAQSTAESMSARQAARRRRPLGGADAQALEGALALTERERDMARAAAAAAFSDLREIALACGQDDDECFRQAIERRLEELHDVIDGVREWLQRTSVVGTISEFDHGELESVLSDAPRRPGPDGAEESNRG